MEQKIIYFVLYSMPALSTILALLIFLFYGKRSLSKEELTLNRVLRCYYVFCSFNWVMVLFYIYNPSFYGHFSALCYITLLITQVLLYHFIFLITRTEPGRKFPVVHYLIPVAGGVLFMVWTLFLPPEIMKQIYASRGEYIPGYGAICAIVNNVMQIRLFYCLFYSILCVRQIIHYRKFIVDYSTDMSRSSLGWAELFLILSLVMLATPGLILLGISNVLIRYPMLTLIPIVILFFQQILLCYNTLRQNYVLVSHGPVSEESSAESNQSESKIDKKQFENYIRRQRPYHCPTLKITDMTLGLGTNRTYLSEFINREYGMNFSTFMNLCRLEELERMQRDPKHRELSNLDMITMVGFGSYDSYLRTKKRRDEMLLGEEEE